MTTVSAPDLALLTANPILPLKGKFISVAPRVALYSGQISGAPLRDPVTGGVYAVNAKNTSGDQYDAQPGHSIDLGSSAGARDLGISRVRTGVTVGEQIRIAETALPLFPAEDDLYFTVRDEWRPWIIMPRGDLTSTGVPYNNAVTLFMDYNRPYFDANETFVPKANITRSATSRAAVKPAGFVDGWWKETTLKTYRTVVLSSAFSLTLTTGGSISGRLWDVGDGTIVSGGDTSTTITVRFPVGFRYITLRVVDNTGNHYGFMRYPIWVHDDTYMPLTRFHPTRNSTVNWREMDFEWYEQDTDTSVIPKGSAVCYWEMPDIPGIPTTIPEQYRDQFLGWTKEDSTPHKRFRKLMHMTVMGIGGWYSGWRGFPMRIFDPGAVPDTWFEMQDITMDRLVYFVLNNMTTAMFIANWYPSPITNILKALDITLGNPFTQINYIVSGFYGHVKCDSLNGMWVRQHYTYKDTAAKAVTETIAHLNRAHWRWDNPPEFARRYVDPTGYLLGVGSAWDGAADKPVALAAEAPGGSQDAGESDQQAPFQNLPYTGAQEELNRLTGIHLAVLNNPWDNIPLELLYDMDVFEPAWMEPITITSSDGANGVTLTNAEFVVKEVNISYNKPGQGREKVITLALEGVVSGDAATTKEVVEDETEPTDSEPFPPIELPPLFPVVDYPEYTGDEIVPTDLIVFDSGGPSCHVAVAINLTTGVMIYDDASTGLTGYNIWAGADPWDYNRYFALQSTGLYRNDAPFEGGTWTLVANNATLFGDAARLGGDVIMSINRRGYILIPCGNNVVISYNYGLSWSRHCVLTAGVLADNWATDHSINYVKVASSPFNDPGSAGEGWTYAGSREGGYGFHFSDDWGETWVNQSSPDTINASPHPHVPYVRVDGTTLNINDANQEVFAQGWGGSNNARTWIITGQGVVPVHYYSDGSANITAPASSLMGRPMSTFTWDGRKYASMTSHSGAGGGVGLMYYDATATKIVVFGPAYDSSYHHNGWTNRFSNHSEAILWGHRFLTDLIYTLDEGATTNTIALPPGYTGASYAEWSLRHLVGAS